jgi:hypothetical protein
LPVASPWACRICPKKTAACGPNGATFPPNEASCWTKPLRCSPHSNGTTTPDCPTTCSACQTATPRWRSSLVARARSSSTTPTCPFWAARRPLH